MSEELKSCPFCDGVESLNVMEDPMYCIECRHCRYCTSNFDTKDELYAFWNNRPIEDEKDKEIKRLKSYFEIQKNLTRQACFDGNRAFDEAEKWKKMFYELLDKQASCVTDTRVVVVNVDAPDINVGTKEAEK